MYPAEAYHAQVHIKSPAQGGRVVFAEFERAMIRERVLAGLERAKEQGISLGRRRLEDCDAARVAAIKRALAL
jgi:DNA invertase Pin-like site-specific DNA recombinase